MAEDLQSESSYILGDEALLEAYVYKQTRLLDLVVRRRLRLCQRRLETFHDLQRDPNDKKTWFLDRACRLEPERAEDIPLQRKLLRPPGKWTVTATVTGQGQPVQLVSARGAFMHKLV